MFKKPSQKGITDGAVNAVAMVAGAKIGDGISAIMPESTSSYKPWALGALGIVAAASVKGTTPTDKAVQNAFIGLGVKQLYNGVTDVLTSSVDAKVGTTAELASATLVDKFQDGIVGHKPDAVVASPYYALNAAWEEGTPNSEIWDRPAELTSTIGSGIF